MKCVKYMYISKINTLNSYICNTKSLLEALYSMNDI